MLSVKSAALFDCYDADGDGEDMADAITGFADECQLRLGLATYPALETCLEFENDYNLYPYMGDVCSPNCTFGLRSTSSSDCYCDDGYWGDTCQLVCPGGALLPCTGYGTCEQLTGVCNCPINRLGSDDCSVCSEGWYGDNCDISLNEELGGVDKSLSMVAQLGILYSLDGLSYAVKATGELLVLAISDNIIIESKFITCYQNYSCMPFLSARIGDSVSGYATVTVQSDRAANTKPKVYLNGGDEILDSPAYFKGFKVYRSNYFEVTFEVKDIVTFFVRTMGQYLHFSMELDQTYVPKTTGLLSGGLLSNTTDKLSHFYSSDIPVFDICTNPGTTQNVLSSESNVVLTLSAYSQSYGNETTLDITRYSVPSCDSFIHYPSDDLRDQTQGGYGLSFSHSSLHSELTLDVNTSAHLTIEMLIKAATANDSGVLFGFTSDLALALVSGETGIDIHTYINGNDTVTNSLLSIDENAWNKIVFTYDSDSGESALYTIDKDGAVSTTGSFHLEGGIFNDTGTLSIGHWRPPSNSKHYNLMNSFEGYIENFLIWNQQVEASDVTELWEKDPVLLADSLQYALQFDEGDGGRTVDSVAEREIIMPEYPWKAPEWIVSDLAYNTDNTADYALIFFLNNTWKSEAYKQCEVLFSSTCSGVSNATLQFFYVNCLQTMASLKTNTAGYNAILDAFKVCESQHNKSNSDISTYCSNIDDTDRNGTSCTTTCPFGLELNNGSCTCFTGYYGSQCDSVCPGSSDSPCSNHGECQSSGTCKCWWNWNGNAECSACSNGASGDMIGPDCTILDTTSLSQSSKKVGAASSNGYYMTFSGQQISFVGETGAFMLFSSSYLGVDVHVYQVACNYGSCIAAVSLASSTTSVVIAPPGQGYAPLIYKNGILVTLQDKTNVFDTTMTVTQSTLTETSVTVTSIGSLTMTVQVQEQFLQASVISDSTVCQDATGVFGSCVNNIKDYSLMTSDEIKDYIVTNFRLSSSIILDALEAPVGDGSNITGYALKFDKTAAISGPLSYPTGFSLADKDFSLSMYFKPFAYGGYIVSYGSDINFAILNTNPIQIQHGATFLATSVTTELDGWNQLILTFHRDDQLIDLYYFGPTSMIMHEILSFDCPGIFEEGGTVMLGEYTPSTANLVYTYDTQSFRGVIDEISIWKNPIPSTLIYQAHLLSTKASGFSSELSALISFTEGVGTVAFEEINGNNFALPKSPWQSPEWIVSDLGLQPLRVTTNSLYDTIDIDPEVEAMCSSFFDSSTVSSNCGGVSDFIRWWYKQTCMIVATTSGDKTDTTMSMVDYASVCDVTGGTLSPVYDIICGLNVTLPGWLDQKCSGCAFGFYKDGGCVCYYGYYGTTCDSVCPGGAATPCNLHGVCDTSGTCQCSGHWDGSTCDTCETDWSGDDCTVMKMSSYDPIGNNHETLVAQVNLLGQLSMFDGVITEMPLLGYYELMSLDMYDVKMFGRFSVCESSSVLHACMAGFIIEHNGEKYYFSHEAYDGTSSVEIMTSTSTLTLYDTLKFGLVTLELESPSTVKMTVGPSGLAVKLSSITERLLATMSIPKTEWDTYQANIQGIVTHCDTQVAIKAANCSSITRDDICTNTALTIPGSCELSQSQEALTTYLSNSEYGNEAFKQIIEEKYLPAMEPNCFEFVDSNGVTATDLTMPAGDFTLEMHVKPNTTGGIVMTYDSNGDYIVLVNGQSGLIVVMDGKYVPTDLQLELNTWNQISMAWRDDAEILELYLTNSTGMCVFYSFVVFFKSMLY